METKDYQNVIDYIRANFIKSAKSGSKEWLPSILSISADLIDTHKKNMATECNVALVETIVGAEKQLVQFYVYDESHTLIFKPALELPDRIQIHSQQKNVKQKSMKHKPSASEMQEHTLIITEGKVILKYYENGVWDDSYYILESYKDILASIFFFCPNILWCAITEEIGHKQVDTCIVQAVERCLRLYVFLDEIARNTQKETYEYSSDDLVRMNNFHCISEIKDVVIELK